MFRLNGSNMQLHEARIGCIVQEDNIRVGHIVGLQYNAIGEIIALVKWASDKELENQEISGIHFSRLIEISLLSK